jgi:proteasome accessory factor C
MSKNTSPKDLQSLCRVFNLIKLLSAPPYYKVAELAERLDVSRKTVYNYLELLESIGYEPDKNRHHQYFLPIDRERKPTDGLELEDAKYLQEMLWQMPDTDHRRNPLLLWLNRQYAIGPVVENLTRYTPAEHRKRLTEALENKKRIRLINYRDASGRVSRARYLEPVAFQQDYTYLYAYDLDKRGYRQFHLGRVGLVEVLEEDVIDSHFQAIPDLFGWTGASWLTINLDLTPRAKQLLLEEYPQATPYVSPLTGGRWLAALPLKGFEGCGRWCLGLCAEVNVLSGGDGERFREYLNGKLGEGF